MNSKQLKKYFLALIVYSLPGMAYAQQQFTLNGVIYKRDAEQRIAQATITDLNSQVIMMSDELGSFSIKTAKGDTLLFKKAGFTDEKVVVTDANDMAIYMHPVVYLPEVAIKEKSNKAELNDVINTYRAKGLYFDGKPPLSIFSPFGGSPITGFYELFSKDAANERRFIKYSKTETENISVDKRYTKDLVKRVTGLPDEDVVKFMQQYTPSFEDMKEWSDYDLISHIKKFLIYYKKNKGTIQLETLSPPAP